MPDAILDLVVLHTHTHTLGGKVLSVTFIICVYYIYLFFLLLGLKSRF